MKKTMLAVMTLLAAGAFAQSQVDVAVAVQAPDFNKAEVNKIDNGAQKSKKAFNVDTNVKYTYSLKLDDKNTIKLGAAVDLYTPFYKGDADPQKSQWAAKALEPFVQYQGFGVDVLTSLAVYAFGPDDTLSGTNALGFYTGPLFSAKKAFDKNPNPVSNYLKASYKYAVDANWAVSAGIETDLGVAPILYLIDAKPQASLFAYMTQTDVKYTLAYTSKNYDDIADEATVNGTKTYLEPKFTLDVGALAPAVKGLKAYAGGKFILSNTNVLGDDTDAEDVEDGLTGSSFQPGVSYSTSFEGVPGTFGVDTNVKFNGIGPDDVADNKSNDFNLKLTYQIKF